MQSSEEPRPILAFAWLFHRGNTPDNYYYYYCYYYYYYYYYYYCYYYYYYYYYSVESIDRL